MIQEIQLGTSTGGATKYVNGKEGAQRLDCGTIASSSENGMRAEFAAARALRPKLGRACAHISLSLPPGERLTDEQWQQAATRYMEKMGFENAPWAAWRHTDTDHDHIHIVAARIDMVSGQTISDSRNYAKGAKIVQQIEKDYHLTPGAKTPGQAASEAIKARLSPKPTPDPDEYRGPAPR